MSDRGLVERASGGCRESFAALLESYYVRIYRLAWRFCGSQPLAEDIAQDVCVKLATGISSYRGEAAFSSWVWRITYTTAIDPGCVKTASRIQCSRDLQRGLDEALH